MTDPEGSEQGMEHRWKVYIVQTAPRYHRDWTEVSAESRDEAEAKALRTISRRTGEWKLDPERASELIL